MAGFAESSVERARPPGEALEDRDFRLGGNPEPAAYPNARMSSVVLFT